MNTPSQAHPLDLLTAALGGRRINLLIWVLWLLSATIAHYVQDMAKSEIVHGKTKATFAICPVALVIYAAVHLRGVASKEGRRELFSRQQALPSASLTLRILVWVVAILALGAALAPAFIR